MPWTAFNELEDVAMNRFGLKYFLLLLLRFCRRLRLLRSDAYPADPLTG